jgi:hypothetical protein
MKVPLEIFNLTKREQRVVILIMLGLLAIAIANHYREARSHISIPPTASSISGSPIPSPAEDDQATSDETP